MRNKLSDVEKQLADERKRAAAWARTHEKDLEPVPTDPSRVREQVMQGGVRVDRLIRLGMYGEGEDDEVVYAESGRFMPLMAQEKKVNVREADLAARVRHVQSFITAEQRAILRAYYVEGLTWKELRHGDETRQAVHERIAWARKAFGRAWIKHAIDKVVLTEEDF